jgi:hypothetical protein
MNMVRLFLTLSLVVIASITIAQIDEQFKSMRLLNCEIEENQLVNDTIYGLPFSAAKLIISAESRVQMSCNLGNPSSNRYEIVKNKFSILAIKDASGKLKDSVLAEINSYLDEREIWSEKYHVNNDFSNLPFYKSFYLSDSTIVPSIWSGSEKDGDFYIYYLNNTLIKIQLIEHQGLGALSSFNEQNLIFKIAGKNLIMDNYIKTIDEARSILKAYNKQAKKSASVQHE